jgi:hypothetical protein
MFSALTLMLLKLAMLLHCLPLFYTAAGVRPERTISPTVSAAISS